MAVVLLLLLAAMVALAATVVQSPGPILLLLFLELAWAAMVAMVVPMVRLVVAEREGVVAMAAPVELGSVWPQPSLQAVREQSAFQVLRALQARQVQGQPVAWVAGRIPMIRRDRVLVV